MFKRILPFLLCLFALVLPACAQTGSVTVSGSQITDSSGNPLSNVVIYFAPVNNHGAPLSYKFGGKGQAITRPSSATVTNGAFSLTLPDTSLTLPQNVCFAATVIDNTSGNNLLGTGYGCVQPAYNTTTPNNWCVNGACNFDNYQPNAPSLVTTQIGPTGPQGPQGVTGATGATGPAGPAFSGGYVVGSQSAGSPTLVQVAPQPVISGVTTAPTINSAAYGASTVETIAAGNAWRIRTTGVVTAVQFNYHTGTGASAIYVRFWTQNGSRANSFNLNCSTENLLLDSLVSGTNTVTLTNPCPVSEGDYWSVYVVQGGTGSPMDTEFDGDSESFTDTSSFASVGDKNHVFATSAGSNANTPVPALLNVYENTYPQAIVCGDSRATGNATAGDFFEKSPAGPGNTYNDSTAFEEMPLEVLGKRMGWTTANYAWGGWNSVNIEPACHWVIPATHPKVVWLPLTCNDTLNNIYNQTTYFNAYATLMTDAQAVGAKVIMTSAMACVGTSSAQAAQIDSLDSFGQSFCTGYGNCTWIDTRPAMSTFRAGGTPGNLWNTQAQFQITPANNHFNPLGVASYVNAVLAGLAQPNLDGSIKAQSVELAGSAHIDGSQPQAWIMGRSPYGSAEPQGQSLTIEAGGAQGGSTDQSGGALILSAGTATGLGYSSVQMQCATGAATGTTDAAPGNCGTFDHGGFHTGPLGDNDAGFADQRIIVEALGTHSVNWGVLQVAGGNQSSIGFIQDVTAVGQNPTSSVGTAGVWNFGAGVNNVPGQFGLWNQQAGQLLNVDAASDTWTVFPKIGTSLSVVNASSNVADESITMQNLASGKAAYLVANANSLFASTKYIGSTQTWNAGLLGNSYYSVGNTTLGLPYVAMAISPTQVDQFCIGCGGNTSTQFINFSTTVSDNFLTVVNQATGKAAWLQASSAGPWAATQYISSSLPQTWYAGMLGTADYIVENVTASSIVPFKVTATAPASALVVGATTVTVGTSMTLVSPTVNATTGFSANGTAGVTSATCTQWTEGICTHN